MDELLADTELATTAQTLRDEDCEPVTALEVARERFSAVEADVQAFVEPPEWDRLETRAEELAERFPERDLSLYGVPVGVKDVFHVDGLETRAGSAVPPAELENKEAEVVTALKKAGALILGKTVTAEFAHFAPGPTRNPHDLAHTPGGSSSGSAAAVAAGLCPLALGTQTIGSVIRPAAFCGVVGVKPSYDRVPTGGVVPVAPSVDTVGYFAQDVPGARLAAGVLYDEWDADDAPEDLETVGVVDGPYVDAASPDGRAHFETAIDRLAQTGFDCRRIECIPDIDVVNERHERLVAAEMALSHSEWYPEYSDRYATPTRELIDIGRETDIGELCDARASRQRLRRTIHDRMDDHDLDVVVSPSAPGAPPAGIDSTGDPVMNLPWTHAGVPAVSVPATYTDAGLPMGIQCVARFGADERLLSWTEEIRSALSS